MRLDYTSDLWWKNAVIYCLDVETYADSDGDGVGDFRGLTEKLDYLKWLGVDCLWLPPFFTSPSRSAPDGPYGDFYVWSDTDELYEEARVIFVDTEPSNWTWDPVRQQYFWHRFFSHQPDLNFDIPRVLEAMLEGMSFWLDMGLDGFRLDAVPYLFERPGTNGENLPETHEALRQVRSYIDER